MQNCPIYSGSDPPEWVKFEPNSNNLFRIWSPGMGEIWTKFKCCSCRWPVHLKNWFAIVSQQLFFLMNCW